MRMLNLTKVNRTSHNAAANPYADSDDPTEGSAAVPTVDTSPVVIFADAIRCFYPRHADRGPGTRITFRDGGGFAVTETFEEIKEMLAAN